MKTLLQALIFLIFLFAHTFGFSNTQNSTHLSKTIAPQPIIVETIGTGKPILFLPGFTTPGTIWKETIKNLNTNRQSHLFSYAGFNGHAPIKMPWYATIKKAIIAYIQHHTLTDVIIVAHSMGGNLAVDIAEKISKLVIVNALPCMREVMMPNVPAENFYYDSPYNTQMLQMDADQFKNVASMMASNMTNSTDKVSTLMNWILEADRTTYVYGYTDLLKLDLRPVLPMVTAKTLILGASFPNTKTVKPNYESQYATLANKTILIAENSKHFIMFDQPEWLYTTLNTFLADEK
ncbi:alpha/beta fold hydrolase [Aquimarina sp. I32.4]|uniref:alpha/beta fold hydrolase n=1 Tax=Aquimarina sp. I32.4 TaxID=2053903 RepID=UPI000CDF136F|nr:alpha/beta hydrolase [Aquimarina sp. I32.4]